MFAHSQELQEPGVCECVSVRTYTRTKRHPTTGRHLPQVLSLPQGALPLPEVPQPVALPQELQEPGARESVSAR